MLPSKSWHHDMTTEKISEREHGKGQWSRDRDNSTVQTAAMGQIPRSTERILVCIHHKRPHISSYLRNNDAYCEKLPILADPLDIHYGSSPPLQ